MSKNFTIKMRLDLEALKQQKQTLLDIITVNKYKHMSNDLDGILNLVDGIQDFIVDSEQAEENEVFNTENEKMVNNVLIAEFMTLPKKLSEKNGNTKYQFKKNWVGVYELGFDVSWDWLMPVIKKLDSIANEKFTILEFDNYRTQWAMIDKPSKYPIEKVYEQTVQFIEHLNKVK